MKLAGTSRHPNVATLGQHEEEVNKRQRHDVSTSGNAMTSQCSDVATSRRLSAISPSQSLKEKRDQNSRVSKNV